MARCLYVCLWATHSSFINVRLHTMYECNWMDRHVCGNAAAAVTGANQSARAARCTSSQQSGAAERPSSGSSPLLPLLLPLGVHTRTQHVARILRVHAY
eukprot:143488-Chlamydomonas_euryale.AAC.1